VIAALYDDHGRFLRCLELPDAPGRLVQATRGIFDGRCNVYVQPSTVTHRRLYRECDSHGSGPRELPKEER